MESLTKNFEKVRIFSDLDNPEAEENFKRLMRAGAEGGETAMREECRAQARMPVRRARRLGRIRSCRR